MINDELKENYGQWTTSSSRWCKDNGRKAVENGERRSFSMRRRKCCKREGEEFYKDAMENILRVVAIIDE